MTLGCPWCRARMVQRRRKSDGHPFMGCTQYPKCTGTRELNEVECPNCGTDAPANGSCPGCGPGTFGASFENDPDPGGWMG